MNTELFVVKYVNYGVANCFEDYIGLHKDLQKPEFKELHDWCLAHERGHLNLKYEIGLVGLRGLIGDIRLDLFSGQPAWKLFKFMFLRPSTWVQVLPFSIDQEQKTVWVSWAHVCVWLLLISTGYLSTTLYLKGWFF